MPADFAPINLTNHFLIAMPGLEDASFARSVVYLCEHSERGALGLIINKPTDISLKKLFDKVDLSLGRADLTDQPVYQGGPVQTERGFVLHEPLDADGLGAGKADELVPAAHFISKGFARGAAPDNLVVLPFGRPEPEPRIVSVADADACPACGDFTLQQRGAVRVCDTCGAAESRQG